MKYIKRILAAPFVFGLVLITHVFFAFKRTIYFIKYGGEFSNYNKNEKATIQAIYEELKNK
jgi:hypothetical protein